MGGSMSGLYGRLDSRACTAALAACPISRAEWGPLRAVQVPTVPTQLSSHCSTSPAHCSAPDLGYPAPRGGSQTQTPEACANIPRVPQHACPTPPAPALPQSTPVPAPVLRAQQAESRALPVHSGWAGPPVSFPQTQAAFSASQGLPLRINKLSSAPSSAMNSQLPRWLL